MKPLTLQQFSDLRKNKQLLEAKEKTWLKGIESDFESVTKLAYKYYLKSFQDPKAYAWAK